MVICVIFNFKMRYNNINVLHFIFFYISKLALLFAQQYRNTKLLILQTGSLHSLCSCISLILLRKIGTCFSFSRLNRFLFIGVINGKFQAKMFLIFRFLLVGFYCIGEVKCSSFNIRYIHKYKVTKLGSRKLRI